MPGHRNREEAVNTQLAILISRYGVTADGETIHVHGKHRPDVLFQMRGLRVVIEGKFAGETPIVATGTGARFGFSLISAITSKGHMRFMITEGGVNAGVFIEFLKRLLSGATQKIFLIVDRGPAHRAKKTKAFVESLGGALRLFFLPPYSPDLNPDELVWNHLKTHTVGRTTTDSKQSFRGKVLSSMRSLQNTPKKIAAFFQKPSLKYAA